MTISCGLSPAMLIQQKNCFNGTLADGAAYNTCSANTDYYTRFALNAAAGAGLIVPLGRRFLLLAEPTYTYGLLKVADAPVTAHLWSAGLKLGLCFGV
jgi:hypothetical protein